MKSNTKYTVQDREAGNKIETFETLAEAESALKEYEELDKKDSIFKPDFYEIKETEHPLKEDTPNPMSLSKDDAIALMITGKKVRHEYFTENEWVKMNGHFEFEFEDGCKVKCDTFWEDRTSERWQTGWSIFEDTPNTGTVTGGELLELNLSSLLHTLNDGNDVLLKADSNWPEILTQLKQQLSSLQADNERLRAILESNNAVISECYGYFSAANFTDRYGTAERLKLAHKNAKAALQNK